MGAASSLFRCRRRGLAGLGLVLLLSALTLAQAGQVVTDRIISQGKHDQAHVPVTFGQVFKQGDVPAGSHLVASIQGQAVPLQVDAKARNPDGSLRHAVVTVRLPSLPEGADLPLTLASHAGAAPAVTSSGPTLQALLATEYDAKVRIRWHGTTYRVAARPLLQAASAKAVCKPWNRHCNEWLSGALTRAWVVHGPLLDASGTPAPGLRVYFAVRAHAGVAPGTLGPVRTDIIIENSDAYAPQVQPQYTATLSSGSAGYTSEALTQYAYTRWHKVLWWNQRQPRVYVRQDTKYIQASKAVSRYMDLQPDDKFLASLRQTCAPLDHCDQTQHMHMAGAQPAIGPLPRWTSVYIVDPDIRAYRWMLANTDALGAYSIHYRDADTGWPLSIQRHPYVTRAAWGSANRVAKQTTGRGVNYRRDLLPACVDNAVVSGCSTGWYGTGNPNTWDNAHQPAQSYVPYLVTGSYYYASELAFAASLNELWSNPEYRGFSKGLIGRAHSQVRGKAWTLRQLAEAAWILPDDHPLKKEFHADVINSIADWNAKYTNNPKSNGLQLFGSGATYPVKGADGKRTGAKAMAPWMHDFFTWAAGHAAELGFAGADKLRDWSAHMNIVVMTDWQDNPRHGFCWLAASGYVFVVRDAAGHWLPDYRAVYAASFPHIAGLECNSPAMVKALAKKNKQAWQAGEMMGYAHSPTGFPANLQIGMAAAADSGLPGAHAAWKIFHARSVRPHPPRYGYNNYPNFAVLPRSVGN